MAKLTEDPAQNMSVRKKLGEIFVTQGIITPCTVTRILDVSRATGLRFGETLLEMGLVNGEELAKALAIQYGYKVVLHFARYSFPKEILAVIPLEAAFEHKVFPLKMQEGTLAVAMWDPTRQKIIENLAANLGVRVVPYISTKGEIMEALRRHYLHASPFPLQNTVLLVDDEAVCRKMMADLLVEAGCQVVEATDGMDAFRLALTHQPNVIVTDKEMPKLDGYALLKSLRDLEETRHIPVLLVSGRLTDQDEEAAFERGFFDYVTKPVRRAAFITRVRRALASTSRPRISGGFVDLHSI